MCINELFDLNDIYEPRWSDELTGKRPPVRYVEDYVSPKALEPKPRLVDFVLHGLSYDEAMRMQKLLYIEQLRSALDMKKRERIYTPQELSAFSAVISERIREYNAGA